MNSRLSQRLDDLQDYFGLWQREVEMSEIEGMKNSIKFNPYCSSQPEEWFNTGFQDVRHLIFRLTEPYVDFRNALLHHDELQADCLAKVGRMLASGSFNRCSSRQEFFALLKVSLKNHISSLVHRHIFTKKRGAGYVVIKHGKKLQFQAACHVSTDDEDTHMEVRFNDYDAEFNCHLQDFCSSLSAEQQTTLTLIKDGTVDAKEVSSMMALRKAFEAYVRG